MTNASHDRSIDGADDPLTAGAFKLIDEIHKNAKSQLEKLIKEERCRTNSIQTSTDEEKETAERFKKLYEQERAKTKILQGRVAELIHIQRTSSKTSETNGLSPGEDAITSKSLTEEYMSIFETVWPDAYHFVRSKKKKDERAAAAYLLDLIKDCFTFCSETSQLQQSTITLALAIPSAFPLSNSKPIRQISLPKTKMLAVLDIRKMCGQDALENVTETYFKKFSECAREPTLKVFTERFLEISWQMCLEYPKVYMDVDTKRGDKFDNIRYKVHKQKGTRIDYVILPAVFVCRGGEVLIPGLAEGQLN